MTVYAYLHGFASSPRAAKATHLAAALAPAGVALRVPDLVVPSFEHQSRAAMLEVVGALAGGGEKLALVGSSLGGWLAARFAEQHPQHVEKLVLLCPAFDMASRWPHVFGRDRYAEWKRDGVLAVADADGVPRPLDWAFVEEGLREPAWPEVPCPTVIVHGTDDVVVPVESSRRYAASRRDRVRLVEVTDDHSLHGSMDHVAAEVLSHFGLSR